MSELWPSVGGMIDLQYVQTYGFNPHPIKLAVAPFDLTPSGSDGDYLYTGTGAVVPTESGLLATFAALGAIWAPYYDSSWQLELVAVYQNVAGAAVQLPATPTATPIAGTYSGTVVLNPTVKRMLFLYSSGGMDQRWRIWLRHLQGDTAGKTVPVDLINGGFDARDRAVYAYLGGTDTGVVARDGTRFSPGGKVRTWWDTSLAMPPFVLDG
jgi:hypothetical protein